MMPKHDNAQAAHELPKLLESLPVSLVRAREGVLRMVRPVLQPLGVTEQQWRVLRVLAEQGVPLSVGELAASTALLGPSIARMLPALEGRRLIVRESNAQDARRVECAISDAGLELVGSVTDELASQYAQIDDVLGPDGRVLLDELLDRLATLGNS